jgi:pimeloyl-ACP methyl ester carboxylesterase
MILRCSPDPAMMRSSSICWAITKAMSRSIPNSRSIFAQDVPPLLAVWGKNDPFVVPAGAKAFTRDIPDTEVHLLEAGHFALESQGPEIAAIIRDFLARKLTQKSRAA